MIPVEFDYLRPTSIEEALSAIAEEPDCRPLAGGQSLLPLLKLRVIQPSLIVDLSRLSDLRSLQISNNAISIGAMATERQIELSEEVSALCPLITETLRVIGDPHVRNLGTIGGALCQADPRGDLPACMLALGATFTARSRSRTRTISVEDFFTGPFSTALEDGELLTTITVPVKARSTSSYMKLSRRAGDFAVVGVAAIIEWETKGIASGGHVAVCGASPAPFLVDDTSSILAGSRVEETQIDRIADRAQDLAEPVPDPLVSVEYRKAMVRTMVERALRLARNRAEGMQ